MRQRLFNFTLLFIVANTFLIYPQSAGEIRFQEMKNCFFLGLSDKGIEIASELLSRPEYSDVREKTVFQIAEGFFIMGVGKNDITTLSRAYTYYIIYDKDFPNSTFSDIVKKRITTLKTYYGDLITFRNLDEIMENEAEIVDKKLSFATGTLFWFANPNIYKFFDYTESEQSSIELLDRYFDEIIINNPAFEIYARYYKIIARLSKISNLDFVKDGEMEFNVERISIRYLPDNVPSSFSTEAAAFHFELENMLNLLSNKYPHHPLVLKLHLIYANLFMLKNDGIIDSDTKKHLEFVVQNQLEKTHPTYLLAKEFLLNNKFK